MYIGHIYGKKNIRDNAVLSRFSLTLCFSLVHELLVCQALNLRSHCTHPKRCLIQFNMKKVSPTIRFGSGEPRR